MKLNKVRGDSPLKLIIITLLIIFFVALFVWQIEKYLAASHNSKIENQISSMNLLIQADNLDAFNLYKYAYLHDTLDIAKPANVKNLEVDFEPQSTLASLFVRNHFTPSGAQEDSCYIYIYFPPGEAQNYVDLYDRRDPGFVLAAWSNFRQEPIIASSPGLTKWAEQSLKETHFYCDAKALRPNIAATKKDGEPLDLPGIEFQFSDLFYSKATL